MGPIQRRSVRAGAVAIGVIALGAGMAGAASAVPVNTAQPTVQGQVRYNETVRCNPGQWAGDGVTYSYEWLRSGGSYATGRVFRLPATAMFYGYTLACQVTATDAAGATATATSAEHQVALGRITLRITKITVLPRGRVRIQGTVAPGAMYAGRAGRDDYVSVKKPVGRNAVTQIADPAPVNARGVFSVIARDSPGRRTIFVDYWSGQRDAWGGARVTRVVRFTPGGGGSSGGSIRIG